MKAIKDRDNLIEVLDEYIKFLGNEVDSNAVFLSVHGIKASDDIIKKGVEFRAKIYKLRKKIK